MKVHEQTATPIQTGRLREWGKHVEVEERLTELESLPRKTAVLPRISTLLVWAGTADLVNQKERLGVL